ncbi:MAG: hypothetical protein LBG27_05645 [Spirochaetaceae bacterium]|jgi:hypothetical protein|nr:hypothetical protein [Spirochaetaceae bacterium]
MTEPRKAALSLLITIFLFAVFTVASFAGLFDLIETRFYNPSVTAVLSRELDHEAGSIEVFFTSIERWFNDSLADPAVKRSFLVNQTAADIYERSEVFARLHEKLDGLQWVRFIDAGGNRIHYSTWQGDLIREDSATAVYRMYTDAAFYMPLENLLPLPNEASRIIFDPSGGHIVFSLPFYDALDAYRGLAVFSLSTSAIQNRLIAERTGGQGKMWLVTEPLGLLRNVPEDNMTGVLEAVAENWKQSGVAKQVSVSALESGGNRTRLVLLTAKTLQGIFIGNLVNENIFVFPLGLKMLLLVLFFISVFLVLFLITNIRQDPVVIVQNRLKNLQINLIKEYYDQKTDIELGHWGMDLMQRREEIRNELKSGLKTKIGKKLDKEIDTYIDKSWNDLLAVIGGRLERTVNEEEIHFSLNRLTNMLSSLVEDGTFTQNGKVPPSSSEADRETDNTGTATGADAKEIADANGEDITSVEEIPASVEGSEEFLAAENMDNTVPDKVEETMPLAVDVEPLPAAEEHVEDKDAPEVSAGTDGETADLVEEIREIEELEGIEEIETLEELDDAEVPSPILSSRADSIARDIEWSETADEAEEPLALELEVSSPFSTPSSTPKQIFTEKNVFDDDTVSLEYAGSSGVAPLLYKPFTQTSNPAASNESRGLARKASLINITDKTPVDYVDLIREQDGIAYIRETALHPTADEEKFLDPRMKGLVDSVLKHAEKEF